MVRLALVVQTHPARAELLAALLASLTPTHVLVARDPVPDGRASALRSYLAALALLPEWASHLCVIQDDALPCDGFVAGAAAAIAARPDNPIAFFTPRQPPDMAYKVKCAVQREETFVELPTRRWAPVVALSWPRELVPEFLAFVEEQKWPAQFGADDEAVGHFLRRRGTALYATVPSLVEHPDVVPSLVGKRPRGGRTAARYIGSDDPLAVAWA